MLTRHSHGRSADMLATLCLLGLVAIGCKLSSLPGAKMNMFEGTNALDGVNKVKQKLGADDLKIKYISIHEDRLEITIQDPAKPKNFDEYTYAKGVLTGPKPVEAMVLGDQEFTADRSKLFSLSEIDLGQVPEVVRKATERAKVEDGKPELISIDWGTSLSFKPKQRKKSSGTRREMTSNAGRASEKRLKIDFGFGWRIWSLSGGFG